MCSIASASESTTAIAIFIPRYSCPSPRASQRQPAPIPRSRGSAHRRPARPRRRRALDRGRQEGAGHLPVDEQRLRRVADPRPLHLRVVGDPLRHRQVGVLMHVDGCRPPHITGTLATSFSARFRPSPPRGMIRSTSPSCVASSRSCSCPPPSSREVAASGSSAAAASRTRPQGKRSRSRRCWSRGGRRRCRSSGRGRRRRS